MTMTTLRFRSSAPIIGVLSLFIVCAIFINPLREMALMDDWAYALTVRHLIQTGEYRLHDWLSANMPFQAVWGALFASLFGYSLAILRTSTLVLMLGAAIAFYHLARQYDLNSIEASLLTLTLIASPLVLNLTFTFMTDVPFLACTIIALWLYTAAVRRHSVPLMLLASVAASAAILVRQFGAAFVPGMLMVWWLEKRRHDSLLLYTAGLILPIAATVIQLYMGTAYANWAAQWATADQLQYWISLAIIRETPWRLMVILQYMALFCLPLIVPAMRDYWLDIQKIQAAGRWTIAYRREVWLLAGLSAFILGAGSYGTFALHQRGILPLIPWNLDVIGAWPPVLAAGLTLFTTIGAVLFTRLFVMRWWATARRNLIASELVIDCVTLFLLVLQLIFFQFGDEYLLHLIPFCLIVVGRQVLRGVSRGVLIGCTIVCLLVLAIAAPWTRGILELSEAQWAASEKLYQSGVPQTDIYTSWEWMSYHGAFDQYLAGHDDPSQASVGEYFDRLSAQIQTASYLVIPAFKPLPANSQFRVIDQVSYEDALLRMQNVYTRQRIR